MAKQNLGSMFRGDDKIVQFTLPAANLPSDGVASFSFWFTAKSEVDLPDSGAQFQKLGLPGALGPFTIVTAGNPAATPPVDAVVNCAIAAADTSSLPDYDVTLTWDLQVRDANGKTSTAASGTLTVQPDVTRA